ncbi:helix-turn-helix domain-containing protein [Dickeya dianthicola]|uniref:GlxA family transcriptional regulator n=1 Tax=Dickeya dianthicola TaxID=204039 RepID=UPI00136CE632|nr:helix-turn-helix domain-containing protein [Dickeya dianthicola]MCI4186479.1 helix-turn-helix domain-containing protein [Dickeya dianthicola]MCI4237589.1 helix-turn-helix domain-containing protein [Dickeya dianthicola]MCI4257031.1 helix-turn-helix domain-containing protein [Dickeya dianthicola]MZG21844.1 helix-turn-helix domain-containing protein [Dickeya dianthicola]MZI87996.1 helix-turn-helix domain-containing protein [Dickeya dianthicola]
MRIAIIAVDGSLLSAIAGLSDLFWITNQALRTPPKGVATGIENLDNIVFETSIVSADGKALHDPQGRVIPVDADFQEPTHYNAVLVTGMALGADGLPPHSDSIQKAANWLNRCHQHGVLVGAACAGTFVLGEAGLLNDRRCTTTWWLHHAFKRRFPKARAVWGTAVEEQDSIITTGGPLSWVDLGLHVIRRLAGADIAKLAADISVADSLPLPQLIYAPRGFINTADPLLLQAEQIIRHTNPNLTTEGLAKALNLSERTLHRRLKTLSNESPKEFITRVRIETACVLLDTPGASVKQVATLCGYNEETSFRRAFNQVTGMTPVDYKRWSSGRNRVSVDAKNPPR